MTDERPNGERPGRERARREPPAGRDPGRRPPPRREPRFAPVVFDDDRADPDDLDEGYDEFDDRVEDDDFDGPGGDRGGGRGGGGRRQGDGSSDVVLFRVLGVIIGLGILIIALVLPWSPISLVGGGDDPDPDSVTAEARESFPALPPGLTAMSQLYDVTVPEGEEGPWTIDVTLDETVDDDQNLAYYTHDGEQWRRLVSVSMSDDGHRVSGVLDDAPGSIAVLRRDSLASDFGVLLDAGDAPDPAGINSAGRIAVRAASVEEAGDGTIAVSEGGLHAARDAAGSTGVHLGVTGGGDALAQILASNAAREAHVEALVSAVDAEQAAGVYLEYLEVGAAEQGAFADLVASLSEALGDASVIVGVPARAGAGDYDWERLLEGASELWLRPPDVTDFYPDVEVLLGEHLEAGVDLSRVLLVLSRHSVEQGGQGLVPITKRGALTAASAVDRDLDGGIEPGETVPLRPASLAENPGGPRLHWDDEQRMVTFSYSPGDETRTVWIENRFSAAFRMDVARRYGLGGVVVDPAVEDPALAQFWETVIEFAESGEVTLEQPYGPYLVPCWQATGGELEGQEECWASREVAENVAWRAPDQAGAYEIRLVVSDGTAWVGQELAFNVMEPDGPDLTPTPGATPEPTPSPSPTPTPESTPTPEPTPEPTPDPTPEPTPGVTPTPEPTPDPTPTPEPAAGDNELPPGPAGDDDAG